MLKTEEDMPGDILLAKNAGQMASYYIHTGKDPVKVLADYETLLEAGIKSTKVITGEKDGEQVVISIVYMN